MRSARDQPFTEFGLQAVLTSFMYSNLIFLMAPYRGGMVIHRYIEIVHIFLVLSAISFNVRVVFYNVNGSWISFFYYLL